MVYFHLFHWFKQKPIYLTSKDIPNHLATRQWLMKRGYQPMPLTKGFLQTKTKKIPLYEKERAKKITEGADLTFKGTYFNNHQSIPPYYQPKDYFTLHQLPLPATPIAKQHLNHQFIDLYEIPSEPLTDSQRKQFETKQNVHLSDTVYCCLREKLPSHLKTKQQLSRYGLMILPPQTAQWINSKKIESLYSWEDALNLHKALTQTPILSDRIYSSLKDVPFNLVTFEWLDKRGYRPKPTVQAFLLTNNQTYRPLFLKEGAQPFSDDADLSFKGRYYRFNEQPKENYKNKSYFERHNLPLPSTPIAKQQTKTGFQNLYKLPTTILTHSQRQELELELRTSLSETIYLCEWNELPSHLKTKRFFFEAGKQLPQSPVAQLFIQGKIHPLYQIQ